MESIKHLIFDNWPWAILIIGGIIGLISGMVVGFSAR